MKREKIFFNWTSDARSVGQIMDHLPDIIYVVDQRGYFRYLNAAVSWLGYRPADLIGRHFSRIIYPADRRRVIRKLVLPRFRDKRTGAAHAPQLFDERRTGSRQTRNLEIRLLPRPGVRPAPGVIKQKNIPLLWASVSAVGYYRPSSRPSADYFLGSVGVIRNITERKINDEKIQAQEKQYQFLANSINDGLIMVDHQDRILFVNEMFCQITGYRRDELIGRIGYRLLFAPAEQAIIKKKNALCRKKIADKYEIKIIRKNGACRWVQISGSPLINDQGQIIGSIGIFSDITDRKAAEVKLHLQAGMLQQVNDAIVTMDSQFRIQTWNPAAEQLFGYRTYEVINNNFFQLTHLAPITGEDHIANHLRRWGFWRGEVWQRNRHGDLLVVNISLTWIKNAVSDYAGIVAVLRDMTDRFQMEKNLKHRLQMEMIISRISQQIMRSGNVIRSLSGILKNIAQGFNADAVYFLIRSPQSEQFNAVGQWQRPIMPSLIQQLQGITRQKHPWGIHRLKSGQPINCLVKHLPLRSRSRFIYQRAGIKAIMIVPFFFQNRLMGTIDIFSRQDRRLGMNEDVFFIQTAGEVIMTGILKEQIQHSLNRALQELQAEKKRLLELTRKAIDTQEKERFYLSAQIHDDLLQDLASILYALHEVDAGDQHPFEPKKRKKLIGMIKSLINRGRALIRNIEPLYDPEISLVQGIQRSFEMKFAGTGIRFQFHRPPVMPKMPFSLKVNILRIVQEAFANILKHSQADRVLVRIMKAKNSLVIVIRDNGIGFPSKKIKRYRGHYGLLLMQARAQIMNSDISIASKIGQGTEIQLKIPLKSS